MNDIFCLSHFLRCFYNFAIVAIIHIVGLLFASCICMNPHLDLQNSCQVIFLLIKSGQTTSSIWLPYMMTTRRVTILSIHHSNIEISIVNIMSRTNLTLWRKPFKISHPNFNEAVTDCPNIGNTFINCYVSYTKINELFT